MVTSRGDLTDRVCNGSRMYSRFQFWWLLSIYEYNQTTAQKTLSCRFTLYRFTKSCSIFTSLSTYTAIRMVVEVNHEVFWRWHGDERSIACWFWDLSLKRNSTIFVQLESDVLSSNILSTSIDIAPCFQFGRIPPIWLAHLDSWPEMVYIERTHS